MTKQSEKSPRIILFDIETSLIVATTFSLRPDSIPHDGIIQDWSILCGAWKELGSQEVHAVQVKKVGDDKQVVKQLRDVLVNADIIVAHNGAKFDIKKLNARLIYHKLPPLPVIPMVDTLKEVRKIAAFTSNRLDYLGKHLLGEGKLHTDSGLWMKVLQGDKQAIVDMVEYNKVDVLLLEKVYLYLRPYMKNHPHVGVILGDKKDESCSNCGGTQFKKRGKRLTATGVLKQEHQCKTCGHYHTTTIK